MARFDTPASLAQGRGSHHFNSAPGCPLPGAGAKKAGHSIQARRAHVNAPVGETRQGEESNSRGCREGSSPNHPRRQRYYRFDQFGGRHPLSLVDHVTLLLTYNRALPVGERIRWGWALLLIVTLFVGVTGWAVVLP